jgi:predicted nucleotidyltransferase
MVSDSKQAITALEEVVTALREGLGKQLVALVLFGSRARGDAGAESDWDILLVARGLPEGTLQRHIALKKMLPDAWRGQVSLLAKTPEEFEARLPSLYLDVALDGVVLYDTQNYMTARLSALERLLEQQGLARERVQGDLVWRWEEFPGLTWSLEWGGVS